VQLIGFALLLFVVWFGFADRSHKTITAFDVHALVVVLCGSIAAVLVSSSTRTAFRTFSCLRELLPAVGTLQPRTDAIDAERIQLSQLWLDGKRAQAVQLAQNSDLPSTSRMLDLVISRAPEEATRAQFTELRHADLSRWQPAISNWELLAKLAPSFGMVGTITGMIQLFQTMGEDNLDMGAALSLALLATLYGVAFGAGVAGPVGHYLRSLLDERIGALERCEQSVGEMIARSMRESA
jgi:chemotaxis protein MotA